LQAIIDRTPDVKPGEAHLGALTTANRTDYYETRQKYFTNGLNAESISKIDNALQVIFLDENEHKHDKVADKIELFNCEMQMF
jgi:hypothetical protein